MAMRPLSLVRLGQVLFICGVGVFLRSTTTAAGILQDEDPSRHVLQQSLSWYIHRSLQQQGNNNEDSSFTLTIPDIRVETDVFGTDVTVDLTAIECRNLIIQQVQVELQPPLGNGIPVFVALRNVNITCRADYDYEILFGSGGGEVELDVYDMTVESQVVLVSPNLASQPPNSVWFNECTSVAYIDRLQFDGDGPGIVANALNAAGPLVQPRVQKEIGDAICEQVQDLESELADLLTQLSNEWEPYWKGTTTLPDEGLLLDEDNLPADALNLQDPGASNLGTLFDIVLDKASEFLSSRDDDTGLLEVNRILQDLLVDPVTGDYEVDSLESLLPNGSLYAVSTPLGLIQVELKEIVVHNLGTAIQRVDPIQVVGPYSLQGGLALSNTTIAVQAVVSLAPLNATSSIVRQTLEFALPIERLVVQVTGVVLTSESSLGAITLGSLLDTERIVDCVLPAFDRLAVSQIQVDEFVLDPTSSFSTSTEWIQNVAESNITIQMLNTVLDRLMDDAACPAPPALDGTVDWRELLLDPEMARAYGGTGTEPYGDIGPLLKDYIDSVLLEPDDNGYLGLAEEIVYPVTNSQSGIDGVWLLADDLVNIDQDINFGDVQARFALQISDVRFENLASIFAPITILDPMQNNAYRTLNSATLGNEDKPIRMSFTTAFGFSSNDVMIQNLVQIQVELWNTTLSTTLLLRMAERYLMKFPLRSLFDVNCLASLLHTPELDERGVRLTSSEPSLSLENLEIILRGLHLSVDCIECSSPEVEEISSLLKHPERGRDAARAISDIVDWGLSMAEDDESFLQLQIDRFLVDSSKQCELHDDYDPNFTEPTYASFEFSESSADDDLSFRIMMTMVGVVGGIAVAAIGIVTLLRHIVTRRHRKWLKSLPRSQLVSIYAAQQAEEEQSLQVNKASTSLFTSPHVPIFLRYFVPLVLLGNIALFLSGHFSLGGSVQIYIQLAGEEIVIDDFYKFSIVQSAKELWDAGGVELAIMIFLFSGIWPYTKLLITMALWFAPPSRVSIGRRGSILLWLDTLGKWSMVDVFVMMISIVAFRVTIRSPDYSFLTPDFYKVDLVVAPLWGLYANMTAQLVTQFSSHLIIHYHRKDELAGVSAFFHHKESVATDPSLDSKGESQEDVACTGCEPKESDGEAYSLQEAKFLRAHKGEGRPLYLRPMANYLFILGSTALIALNLLGYLLPSFSFENLGIVGIAIEFGQNFEEASQDYSISGIAQLLMDQGRFLGSTRDLVGHFAISALLVVCTLVVPYILIALLLFQLWFPMVSRTRRHVDVLIESFAAWQYIDVYLLSVVVASWQVGDISSYLVNPYCGSLDRTFSELVSYGILEEDDAQCFSVRSRIEPAVYTLVVSAVLLSLLMSFVANGVRQLEYQSAVLARWRERRTSLGQEVDFEDKELCEKIHPVPLLLSDRFRWLLREGDRN